ncbi:MAG: UbiA family prenyltransferase [Planctomycetes bacterium]|nr:UbiA family prenyltransferase [Planctomycetota bacterium]
MSAPSVAAKPSRLKIYWDFVRPFTLLPPMLGMLSGAFTAIGAEAHHNGVGFVAQLQREGLWSYLGFAGLGALMAATLNAASNVLNQLTDLQNDRINKPSRPLPAGLVTVPETIALFLVLYVIAIAAAWFLAPKGDHACFWIVVVAAIITYVYSAPPFRTKRWGALANLTIAIPRGLLLKVAGWAAVVPIWGIEPWYVGSIFFFFLLGAATTKDYSDMDGDLAAGCITLPIKYGVRKSAYMISPFFVFPWFLLPIGALVKVSGVHYSGTPVPTKSILSGNPWALVALGVLLASYGAYVAYLILKDPDALKESGENHPSWTHMYRMMMVAQVGFAVAYVLE